MKLIKLVMCAFGSYAEETVIDFSDKQAGIFLITGDTGSGKTTIFDGITYALYGKTSGDKREGSMMRSQFAPKSQQTYVEFSFRIKRDVYMVRRNPAYQIETRYKNGKVKMVNKDETVILFENGQEFVTTRKTETNKRIQEIIKLDFDQFTQIAMIAQGDFMKLLTADTKKKKEIFSKLFHTEIYQSIAKGLEEKRSACYQQLKDAELLCRHQINLVQPLEKCKEQWEQVKELPFSRCQEVLELLTDMLGHQQVLLEQEQNRLAELSKQQELNQEKISYGESLLELFGGKEQLVNQCKEKFSDINIVNENEILSQITLFAEQCMNETQKMQPLFHRYNEALMVFEQVHQAEENLKKADNDLKSSKYVWDENKKKYDCIKEDIAKKRQESELLGEISGKLLTAEHELEKISAIYSDLNNLQKIDKDVKDVKKVYDKALMDTSELRKEKALLFAEAQQMEDMYFMAQAGILAEHLEEGIPCPVCGSPHHPKKAILTDGAPDKNSIDKIKKECKRLEQILQEQILKEASVKSRLENMTEQLVKNLSHILEQAAQSFSNSGCEPLSITSDALTETQKIFWLTDVTETALREKKAQVSQLNKEIRYLKTVKSALSVLEKDVHILEQTLETNRTDYQKMQLRAAKAEETLNGLKTQTFESSELEIKEKQIDLKRKLRDLQEKAEVLNQFGAKLELYLQQIGDREKPDLTDLYEWREHAKTIRYQLEENIRQYSSHLNKNSECFHYLEEHFSEVSQIAEHFQVLQILYETANGRVTGQIKIDFETYVLRQYLKRILYAANRRLYEMSMGQFVLKLKDLSDAGKVGNEGLDLYVHSMITGTDRDVKTLSGGESFMAALSMALGLSDVVMHSTGSVHLHVMFIDEGFGSLDDVSRNQAIKILNSLAGTKTLVGIISHVSELKDQIDDKLIVTKNERGSSVKWEKF